MPWMNGTHSGSWRSESAPIRALIVAECKLVYKVLSLSLFLPCTLYANVYQVKKIDALLVCEEETSARASWNRGVEGKSKAHKRKTSYRDGFENDISANCRPNHYPHTVSTTLKFTLSQYIYVYPDITVCALSQYTRYHRKLYTYFRTYISPLFIHN